MRTQTTHGLLAVLAAVGLGALVGAAGSASATSNTANGPTTLPRPTNERWSDRGPRAPVSGAVPGLTGNAAEWAAGDAAVRFRSLVAERATRLSGGVGGSGAAATPTAENDLHIGWGTAFAQPNGTGLRATHTVFTGAAAVTPGSDVVYAPTALAPGGACMEMTTAYTSRGPLLWAWDWCGGNAGVGKLVTVDADFLNTYTTTVNGQAACSTEVRQTNASNNTWSSYLYNYRTQVWDLFYTSSGTFDLSDRGYGWDIFEIYSTRNPTTATAWYCSSMAGQRFEASSIEVNLRGHGRPPAPAPRTRTARLRRLVRRSTTALPCPSPWSDPMTTGLR
jgi:hypothetical protein